MCGFIALLVEHCTGIAEVTGSIPVEALIFSGSLILPQWHGRSELSCYSQAAYPFTSQ